MNGRPTRSPNFRGSRTRDRVLIVASWNPLEEWYQFLKSTFDTEAEWGDYYPIIRAMLGSWRALDGTELGFSLPLEVSQPKG